MTFENPKVSILMNCRNGEKYVKFAINSILAQTYENWELVFFDNYSTDKTKNIVNSFSDNRIKYFYSKKKLTLGQARKSAETYLNGDFIAILDSDDLWNKDKLSIQIKILTENQDASLIFTAIKFFNNQKTLNYYPYKSYFKKNLYRQLLDNYQIPLVSVLINRNYISKIDLFFDDTYNSITDFDLFLRLSRISNVIYLPQITASWRLHDKNETIKNPFYFVDEKEIWLDKNEKNLNKIYLGYYENLLFKNNLERARISLNVKGKIEAIKIIFKYKKISFKFFYNLFFIILPFSRYYITKRHKKNL